MSTLKDRSKLLYNAPFIASLGLLIVNDLWLKGAFHNEITGKLSDFCGLFVFAQFWSAFFHRQRSWVHWIVAMFFIWWKSPWSQGFIDWVSWWFITTHRTVDITDLWALIILVVSYKYQPQSKLKISPLPIVLISFFAFVATSVPTQYQNFKEPPYLLLRTHYLIDGHNSDQFEFFPQDSLIIVRVNYLEAYDAPLFKDDFARSRLAKDLLGNLIKELRYGIKNNDDPEGINQLITVKGSSEFIVKRDSVEDHLNFQDSFLHGSFKRYNNQGLLQLDGHHYHGLQDSVWTYYGQNGQLHTQKYFEKGELVREDLIENNQVITSHDYFTRAQKIIQKKFVLALLLVLALGLFYITHQYRKRLEAKSLLKPFGGCVASFLIPVLPLLIAHQIYRLIPHRHEPDFQPFGFTHFSLVELGLAYMVVGILHVLLITSEKKLRANLWVLLSFSVIVGILLVFLNELFFLLELVENYRANS